MADNTIDDINLVKVDALAIARTVKMLQDAGLNFAAELVEALWVSYCLAFPKPQIPLGLEPTIEIGPIHPGCPDITPRFLRSVLASTEEDNSALFMPIRDGRSRRTLYMCDLGQLKQLAHIASQRIADTSAGEITNDAASPHANDGD